jgi:hypothetical protein
VSSDADFYGPRPKLPQDRYKPRSPSSEVLFQVVRDHLDEFLETVSLGSDGHGLPSFVEDELRAFISCGDLRGGFARFRCRACGFERLLPFSCKGRWFCPSCISRRAAERSAHLIDHVIPPVPVRQFVLSLPVQLRYVLAWRHELCLEVLGIFADALMEFYRELARKQGIEKLKTGIISIIQRFGGSINLNIHFHLTALDGVFYKNAKGKLEFQGAPSWLKQQDITVLCSIVRLRVLELFKKRGFLDGSEIDSFAEDEPTFASMLGASATSRIATGQRAGKPVLRLVTLPPNVNTRKVGRGAHIDGFDLHAGAALAGNDTKALENLLRYQLRPPVSKQRLSRLPDGRVKLRLRTPWNDGTTSLVFSPQEFLERLASLVPKPRKNLIIYHGCFAPRAKDREEIVNFGRPAATLNSASNLPLLDFERIDDDGRERKPGKYYTWSELLGRVWGAQILKCPKCNSTLKLVALVTASCAIKAILIHIGLETPPPLRPHFQEQLLLFDPAELRPRFAPTSCRSPPTAKDTPAVNSTT